MIVKSYDLWQFPLASLPAPPPTRGSATVRGSVVVTRMIFFFLLVLCSLVHDGSSLLDCTNVFLALRSGVRGHVPYDTPSAHPTTVYALTACGNSERTTAPKM